MKTTISPYPGVRGLAPVISALFLFLALTASAAPLKWVCNWPEAKSQTFSLYHGESATFEPVFVVNGKAVTNLAIEAVYCQTNGMADAWWLLSGATFAPSNDCGAASYRFFVRAVGADGVNYRANGMLRMIDSPGFTPGEVALPVRRLDFSTVELVNAPYYSKAETDAKIVELSPPADLSSATNYTDSVAENLREGLAVAASSATNYTDNVATTLRGEIAAAQPADYETVKSNATVAAEAVAGLGDLAWVDGLEWSAIIDRPTTWAWSAITGKPTTWDWSAISSKPTTLAGYGITDAISRSANTLTTPGVYTEYLINSYLQGGVRIRYSSSSDANQTTYMYNGVAARRNGTTTDYLWDTSSQSGIVRRSELDDKADASVVTTLANKVDAIETWAIGDETQLRIENAGQTNATLQITYTNDLMFSTAVAESNTLAKARADATALDLALADAFDTALAGKADRAWGNTTSSGAPSPADELIIEKPKLALTGGGNYSYIEASTGGYWVMSISLGSEWTLESLADAQNPTNPATIAMHDAEGNAAYTITSTSSREAYTVAGEQYIYCRSVGGNDVITLTYPVVADSAPTIEYAPSLANEFATVENWPGYIASVVSTGHSGMWTNTVTMVGHPGKGFFQGKYTKAGHTYTRFNQPIGITQITIDDVTYDISVETINGKKLMVLTEAD